MFEIVLFALPFLAYGIWRLATHEAVEEGRKPWPITILFAAGAVLAVLAWVILVLVDRGGSETCIQRAYYEDGRVIPAREVPCEKRRQDVGLPASRDPGGKASGLGGSDPAGPNVAPGPLDPEARDLPSPDTPPIEEAEPGRDDETDIEIVEPQ
jgi:hypothetical protein